MRVVRLLPLLGLVAACHAPDLGNPNAIYPGTPRPFPTSGVGVSNACGLLPPPAVYAALGSSALPPTTGSDAQPPNCTWVTADGAPDAEIVLEVSTDPADVALARQTIAPPLPAGARAVPLGLGAVAGADGRIVVLVDPRTALILRLTGGPDAAPARLQATVVALARSAVGLLGGRRPAGGQLLAVPATARG